MRISPKECQGNGRNVHGKLHDFSENSHGRSPITCPRIWSRPPRTFQILQRSSRKSFPLSPSLFARLPQGLPETIAQECPPGFGKGPPRTLQDFPPGLPQVSRPRMSPGFGQGSPMTLQDFPPGLPQGSRPRESPGFSQDPPRSLPNLTEELLKELSKTPHAI